MRLTVYFPEDSPTTHEFVESKLTIGRLGDNDVQLEEGSVSSHHAEIEAGDTGVVLRDLGSTNGTFLNGEPVSGTAVLSEGDEIYFGSVRTVFSEAEAREPAVEAAESANVAPAPEFASSDAGLPDNFTYMSPLPLPTKPRDTAGLVAWVCAGIGALAAIYAVFAIYTA